MGRIAIVSAMHEELAAVLALMPDEHKQMVAGRSFALGHLNGHEGGGVLSRVGGGRWGGGGAGSFVVDFFLARLTKV